MSARDLSMMGSAEVVLNVNDRGHHVIEKSPATTVEYAFYQHTANALNQAGIATPKLLSVDPTLRKLTLEYIPHQIDQAAVAEDDILSVLARLHRYPPDPDWLYQTHLWSESALEKSLTLLALPDKAEYQLVQFRQHSDTLFCRQNVISGDSNAGNWGRRDNGDVVLFDWERFGRGSPAIDLAPLVSGMGTEQAFINLAERYCRISGYCSIAGLAREIALAKAWIVTEVLTLLDARRKAALPLYLKWYREKLLDWLDNTVKML